MKNTNKKKLWLWIAVAIVVVGTAAYYGVGNYFFNYALVRPEATAEEDSRAPKNTMTETERKNKEAEDALVEKWKETVTVEPREIVTKDNLKLVADAYLTKEPSNRWLIAVHGYKSSRDGMTSVARNFNERGYNVLTPDMRAHGQSEGTYIGMGWLDKEDVVQWIDQIVDENPNAEIVLYGISMGGATVMMTAGEELPSNVKAIIEDCGYTSVYEMFVAQLDYRFGLPEFPIINAARTVATMRAGYDIKEASSLEQLKNAKVPMLFIHGSADTYVPTGMVYEVYDAVNVPKDILIVEGAEHANSDNVNPTAFYNKIWEFLGKLNLA